MQSLDGLENPSNLSTGNYHSNVSMNENELLDTQVPDLNDDQMWLDENVGNIAESWENADFGPLFQDYIMNNESLFFGTDQ